MRFELSDEAAALRDAAAGAARRRGDARRSSAPAGPAATVGRAGQRPGAVWRKLAALAWWARWCQQSDGGLGLDENSLVPLLEEVGRSGLPGPAVETIAVGGAAAAAAGHPGGRHPGGRQATATWSRSGRSAGLIVLP